MIQSIQIHNRIKRAELLGSVGALVLGVGVGLPFARFLTPYTTPLLLPGFLLHSWGMYYRRKLDQASAVTSPGWVNVLYWVCWIALPIPSVYIRVGLLKNG